MFKTVIADEQARSSTISIDRGHKNSNTVGINSDIALADISPRDAKWDAMKAGAELLSQFLLSTEFEKWGNRMDACADFLKYSPGVDMETGEFLLKLMEVYFCHCRHCPTCSWRRSLRNMALFLKNIPKIMHEHPNARWVFMTLTVPNVPVNSLRSELSKMNKAWRRFVGRKEFRAVKGFIRTTEVTCEQKRKGYAHPHFHCLLMVSNTWFKTNYTKQSRWSEIWGDCMRLDVTPVVDIRAVKGTPDKAAIEVLKSFNYSVKPETLVNNPEWMLEYFKQVQSLKFISCGGVLKGILKLEEPETDESLIHVDGDTAADEEDSKARLAFNWRKSDKKYRRFKKGDVGFDS